ncbi:OLC1v1025765C1 [Oldenlandia corymbosa var. corymbosa]|uniref:OLC1v1025765C1 n=1 Tax=Oldenlandia corymbosa var. corymbosa TaxID=529605 RepID=A0AAV1C6Y4_OLDCO|nr:OLC1v1025765C1 [Oldenlandia corymbosa var. corymbosa]
MGSEIITMFIMLALGFFFLLSWEIMDKKRSRRMSEMPPGPRRWPVVGSIFQLMITKSPAHHTFTEMAGKHGPIMTIWLGSMCTVVISSADAAREMFKNHDAVLAGRKLCHAMEGGDLGNDGSIITAQYGPRWRVLKRLQDGVFCHRRHGGVAGASGTRAVDVGRLFFLMAFNLLGNLMFSKDLLLDPDSETADARFFNHATKVTELFGQPNVADYFPTLKWFDIDPQGLRRKARFHVNAALEIAGLYLRERMMNIESHDHEGRRKGDYLDVLLRYQNDNMEGPLAFSSNTINLNDHCKKNFLKIKTL